MSLADPSDVVSTVTQIQFLSRTDALNLKTSTKWLPPTLRSMAMPDDVREVDENLRALMNIDLGKISRGADVPPGTAEQIASLDRAVVGLRFASDQWKQDLAEKLLNPLLGELGPAPSQFAAVHRSPTWLKLYRALHASERVGEEKLGLVVQYIREQPPETVPNALALLTLLTTECGDEQFTNVIELLARTGQQHEDAWQRLFSARMASRIQRIAPDEQAQTVHAWIVLRSDPQCEFRRRTEFLDNLMRLSDPEIFGKSVRRLAKLVMLSELTVEVTELLAGDRIVDLPKLLKCLSIKHDNPATADAQILICNILNNNKWMSESAFRAFATRIRGIDFSFGLREQLNARLIATPKLLVGVVKRELELPQLVTKARGSTDRHLQLFWLTLAGFQLFEGDELRGVCRGLSLLDLAAQQGKIDASHYQLLMSDLLKNTEDALSGLANDKRVESLRASNERLALLYLTLGILSEGRGKIDGVDLDNLSTTMRRLKSHDAGF